MTLLRPLVSSISMARMVLGTFLLILGTCPILLGSGDSVVARVDGVPIYREDIEAILKKSTQTKMNRKQALDKLILFRLAVAQARELKLPKKPKIRRELDKLLYREYLKALLKEKGQALNPSDEQIRQSYQENPLVRVRHLVLRGETKKQREQSEIALNTIQTKLSQGIPFKTLIAQYSQDESAVREGDLDFRGFNNFPEPLYRAVVSLKTKEISRPVWFSNAYHLLQKSGEKSYEQAPATYRRNLASILKEQNEQSFMLASLKKLRTKATIKYTDIPKP